MPTLLLTRPLALAQGFLDSCETAAGHKLRAVLSPLTEPGPTDAKVPAEGVLVFTSGRAVEAAAKQTGSLTGRLAYCVGDHTAEIARAAGARSISAHGTVADLVALLLQDRPGPIVHLRAQISRGGLAQQLREHGIPAEELEIYHIHSQPPTAEALALLRGVEPVLVPVFSPRGAQALARLPISAPLTVVAISEATAQPLLGRGEVEVAERPDAVAMQDLVLRRLGNLR